MVGSRPLLVSWNSQWRKNLRNGWKRKASASVIPHVSEICRHVSVGHTVAYSRVLTISKFLHPVCTLMYTSITPRAQALPIQNSNVSFCITPADVDVVSRRHSTSGILSSSAKRLQPSTERAQSSRTVRKVSFGIQTHRRSSLAYRTISRPRLPPTSGHETGAYGSRE